MMFPDIFSGKYTRIVWVDFQAHLIREVPMSFVLAMTSANIKLVAIVRHNVLYVEVL